MPNKKKTSGPGRPKSDDKKVPVTFRAPESHIPLYAKAAAALGLTLSEFHRLASDKLARIKEKRPK